MGDRNIPLLTDLIRLFNVGFYKHLAAPPRRAHTRLILTEAATIFPTCFRTQSCRLVFAFADPFPARGTLQAISPDRQDTQPRLPPPVQNPAARRMSLAPSQPKSRPSGGRTIPGPSPRRADSPSPGPRRETHDDSVCPSFQN